MSGTPLRRARERASLTQAELADRAGVSRQLVTSAEAGRHAPAVDAALRIARVLGQPVEALFGEAPAPARSVLGEPLREGEAVVASRVGSRLRASPLATLAAGDASWAMPDGVVEGGEVRLFPGSQPAGLIVVGCDPALGLCDQLLSRGGGR
ncbi:MAG TPA: helix-turn-helix transcriptional regulator, partial [Miltoncostaeaceae bacterium]|nr:helix-turn-helix transcriptional regulator [Miltoncostaeaceae bacterium]